MVTASSYTQTARTYETHRLIQMLPMSVRFVKLSVFHASASVKKEKGGKSKDCLSFIRCIWCASLLRYREYLTLRRFYLFAHRQNHLLLETGKFIHRPPYSSKSVKSHRCILTSMKSINRKRCLFMSVFIRGIHLKYHASVIVKTTLLY